MIKDDLGSRMKEFYENIPKTKLMRRTPVAIRIDGKAFHTFTRGFKKPFDDILIKAMTDTTEYLCKNIQGAKFGYSQSDEITLILIDYQTLNTSAWFDYEVQKICSIAASMATLKFNMAFKEAILNEEWEWKNSLTPQSVEIQEAHNNYIATLKKAAQKGAMFDARCFNIPKEEVANLIYWRQLDAMRNSVQMVAQANFPHKELQGLNQEALKGKLHLEKNIIWDNYPVYKQRGTAVYKSTSGEWIVDKCMPILKENWDYIRNLINIGE